ncbi:MAG: cadmium-translocating P-type ATPase [Oscillospiraceae bacterium]|nr:cadmium-translocating P-type ATPase [Oscillospiraceae bacterium]
MSRKLKKQLRRIVIALAAFAVAFCADHILPALWPERLPLGLASLIPGGFGWLLPLGIFLVIYVYIGRDVLLRCFRNIRRGQVFDENFLMTVATVGAFAIGITSALRGGAPEGMDEACAVLLFYQLGEWFQRYAVGRSRDSIAKLMSIRPEFARVLRGGEAEVVSPEKVAVDEIIIVHAGERVPLDGIVTEGESELDAAALTGESLPRGVMAGDAVLSGCVNLTSSLHLRVTAPFAQSTVAKILDLVENAAGRKSKMESFISRFARYYTPVVVIAALLLAVVPPIFVGGLSDWIYRALNFLVVSCPCALVISVPLSFVAGIGAASRAGVLVKGSDYLERLDQTDVFVFDKTGTITKGNFAVTEVVPEERREEILSAAAAAEADSHHPIARSILAAAGERYEKGYTSVNHAGMGVTAAQGTDVILCGNAKLMEENGIAFSPAEDGGTVVYVAKNGAFLGAIHIADELREESREVLAALRGQGAKTILFTGDSEQIAARIAKQTGITDYRAQMLPQDKAGQLEALLADRDGKRSVCFVGDGINDAPVLMCADIGIAMGGVGSDAAIEASDVVLMRDDLRGIPAAKRIAKKTMQIVRQNVIFALAVKLAILLLSALGFANLWISVFGDVGVAVLAILNAMRANFVKE